ncbi:MAG: cupin domain-containing protein [Caulobacteraceae bacterium]
MRWSSRFSQPMQPPEGYGADVADVGRRIGARKLGYNVTVIDPGKAAYPAHAHRINEEMFLVLEGQGEVRIGAERHPVRAGDFIAHPPGGPESAHQLRNTGPGPLKVLSVSTFESVDVIEYPDSDKTAYGVMTVGADGKPQLKRGIAFNNGQPGYWDGE